MKTGREGVFSNMNVTVTMKGEEWFAVLARFLGRNLSSKGATIYDRAAGRLQEQILAASKESLKPPRSYETRRDSVLADQSASFWLKAAVQKLDTRDPADALADAEALVALAQSRLDGIFGEAA